MESNKQRLSILSVNADALNSIKADDYAEKLYQAAKIYVTAGLYVIPLRENSKFLLSSETGMNYGAVSNKLETVERWFHP